MACATCDFSNPCACERRRLAAAGVDVAALVDQGAAVPPDVARLQAKVRAAANVIATLLHQDGAPSAELAEEAEALLASLREEDRG